MNRDGRAIHWAEAFGLSAAVHVGVVFFALDFINDIRFLPDTEDQRPDLLVTSLVLDADTLAAATQVAPETAPGALDETDPETLDDVDPETLTGATPDTETAAAPEELAALEPEQAETLAPEEPEALEPETPEALEPETPEALEPETPDPVVAEPLTPEPVTPEPETPEAVTPDTLTADAPDLTPEPLTPLEPAPLAPQALSPLRPQNDTVAALAPLAGGGTERLTATAPSVGTADRLTATTPTITPNAVAPVTSGSVQTVAPRVTRPTLAPPPLPRPAVAPPLPGSPEAVVGELVAKIRARVGDTCLVAVPQTAADGAPELVMLSSSETAIADFAAAVLDGVDPRPGQRAVLLDPRQCDALNYVRENPSYPAFRLTVGLATDQLSGQASLQGAIGRAGGNYVSLLLIDDNGVVQELNQYLTFAAGEARFDVPVRRAGNARDTSQLLFAVVSTSRPRTLTEQNGQEAAVFFQALRQELGAGAPIVMIPFDLR